MSRIERTCSWYLPLLWPVWQLGAAVEHDDVILTLGIYIPLAASHTLHTISHVSLCMIPQYSLKTANNVWIMTTRNGMTTIHLGWRRAAARRRAAGSGGAWKLWSCRILYGSEYVTRIQIYGRWLIHICVLFMTTMSGLELLVSDPRRNGVSLG